MPAIILISIAMETNSLVFQYSSLRRALSECNARGGCENENEHCALPLCVRSKSFYYILIKAVWAASELFCYHSLRRFCLASPERPKSAPTAKNTPKDIAAHLFAKNICQEATRKTRTRACFLDSNTLEIYPREMKGLKKSFNRFFGE